MLGSINRTTYHSNYVYPLALVWKDQKKQTLAPKGPKTQILGSNQPNSNPEYKITRIKVSKLTHHISKLLTTNPSYYTQSHSPRVVKLGRRLKKEMRELVGPWWWWWWWMVVGGLGSPLQAKSNEKRRENKERGEMMLSKVKGHI